MDNEPTTQSADTSQLLSPPEISAKLDEYVIGQTEAKKFLSVAVYNHYKRIMFNDSGEGGVELSKSNILIIGPTGSGKTLLASTLARILDVPFAMADATALVAASNIGREIENILSKLLSSANNDVKKAERGIVYIDEIDKLAKKDFNRSAGEGVQQGLLKIVERTVAKINMQGKYVELDTGSMLFIVGGAFVGLDSLVRLRIGGTVASMMTLDESLEHVQPDDLAKFGLIPEFVGRMPVIVTLQALDKAALSDALLKPKNSLVAQYKKMFSLDGVELAFSDESIDKISELALELKTGARGLRTIIEDRMLNIMYTIPTKKNLLKVTITPEVITKTGEPIYEYIESLDEPELPITLPQRSRPTSATADM